MRAEGEGRSEMATSSLPLLQQSAFLGSSPRNLSACFGPKLVGTVPKRSLQQPPLLIVEAKVRTKREDRTARHSRVRKKVKSALFPSKFLWAYLEFAHCGSKFNAWLLHESMLFARVSTLNSCNSVVAFG